jgi:hypothetical protein
VQNLQRLSSIIFTFILSLVCFTTSAQIGGISTYKFIDQTNSARIAGLGGDFLTIKDNDITLTLANPSLITAEMSNTLSLSLVSLNSGYKYGYAMYGRDFKSVGSFVATLQFINYGTLTYADETGSTNGTFTANELALNIGWGRTLSPHFSIGANAKMIYSALETYHSFGIAVDASGTYTSLDENFAASLIAKNIGYQIVPYYPGNHEPLPFEMQIGLSERLRHIPLRFSLLYNNIEKWDLSYTDPTDPANQKDPITGETKKKSSVGKFADNFMRHIVLGGELTIAKAFSIRLGYNYRRRQELELYNKTGLSGFSLGFGLHIKMFDISYARTTYSAYGGLNPNYFTISTNLQGFIKKKSEIAK